MTDYCACGAPAIFRCQCGATVCSSHLVKIDLWSLGSRSEAYAATPIGRLDGALVNAWGGRNVQSCGECAYRTSADVARSWAALLVEHGHSSAESAAADLIRLGFWNFGYPWQPRSIGQLTIDAAGATPAWSHSQPDRTAAMILAMSGAAPDLVWVTEVGKTVFTKRPVYQTTPSVPAWFTEYKWESGERVYETSGVFITPDGQMFTSDATLNDEEEVVLPLSYGDALRLELSDWATQVVSNYIGDEELARASAIARMFASLHPTRE